MRMMTPFKTVDRDPQTQADIDKMACSVDMSVPHEAALSALTSVTSLTIIPEEEKIEISLPPLPSIGTLPSVSTSTRQEIQRVYKAQ